MNLLKKFKSLNKINKAFTLILLFILTLFITSGIYFWYFTNYVYDYFGKTSWSHQKDKEAGKYIVEKYFLREKLPDNYSDLKYNIKGYCGFDCQVYISVKVDKSYFDNLIRDKKRFDINLKPLDQFIVSPIYWSSIDNEVISSPKNFSDVYISKDYYPSYYWYQDGHLFFQRFEM